jgi:hypothetical protein
MPDYQCCVPGCKTTRPRLDTDDYARAAGWHIWRNGVEAAICPEHAGNQKRPAPVALEGEHFLPDYQCCAPGCKTTRPRLDTDDYARAAGWHIWRTHNASGEVCVERAICPEHAGNAKRLAPVALEGEQPLW